MWQTQKDDTNEHLVASDADEFGDSTLMQKALDDAKKQVKREVSPMPVI
jgi:hypothetical protein